MKKLKEKKFKEFLKEVFFSYRTQTEKDIEEEQKIGINKSKDNIYKDFDITQERTELIFNHFNNLYEQKNYSIKKAYQILTFDIVVIPLLFGLFKDVYQSICIHGIIPLIILMFLFLFLGIKSVFHCIMAIYPKNYKTFRPIDIAIVKDDKDFVNKMQKYYEFNESSRGIIADHVWLALKCNFLQIIVGAASFVLFFLSYFECPICSNFIIWGRSVMEYKCAFYSMMIDLFNSEVIKAILLSWPLAIIVVTLLFRKKISELLGRLVRFSREGAEFSPEQDSNLTAKDTIKKADEQKSQSAKIESVHNEINQTKALIDLIKTAPFINETISSIEGIIDAFKIKGEENLEIDYLKTMLADNRLSWLCELVDKIIFEGQVKILFQAYNSKGRTIHRDSADIIFMNTKAKNKDMLSVWDFEKYIHYLLSEGLLEREGEMLKLTKFGEYYCNYITNMKNIGRDRFRSL